MSIRRVFLVGAAKCGTTSIIEAMELHEEISCSSVKEPFYFIEDYGAQDSKKGYQTLFRKTKHTKWFCEGSTAYLYPEYCSQKIHDAYPDAKVIIALRNPADMAFSFWKHNRVHSSEDMDFLTSISDQERLRRVSDDFKKNAMHWWGNFLYIERAMFCDQVKRYLDVFGTENVRVVFFDEIKNNFSGVMKSIYDFLGVRVPDSIPVVETNIGGEVRFEFIRKLRNRKYPILKKFIPFKIRFALLNLTRMINVKKGGAVMTPELRQQLIDTYFEEDIRKLEDLLGTKTGWI